MKRGEGNSGEISIRVKHFSEQLPSVLQEWIIVDHPGDDLQAERGRVVQKKVKHSCRAFLFK